MKLNNLKYIFATIIIALLFLGLSGELITRLLGATIVYEYNETLGWAPKKNFSKKLPVVDQSGEKYFVDYSTNEFGFREFGNLDNGRKKILFIGDSWTGDPYASDDESYFGIVKNRLPVEVFTIGGGGYGTLQELLLVKQYAEMIKPDIFVLQFTDNDIINNSYFLEGPSITRNQKNLRPYWVDNQIRYRMSADAPFVLLYKNFRLFRTLDGLLSTLQYKLYKGYYPPQYIGYDGTAPARSAELQAIIDAQKKSAIAVTQFLMSEMKRSLPAKTRLVTFPASADDPEELRIWQTMSRNAGFTTYPSVAREVEEAENNGAIVRIHDGAHWNRLGNRIAGDELVKILQRDLL